ncbi:hypothetical protein H6G89_23420 [Oscillatoria sp. FACHB-1407]|uniref:hypothetical protein n=1 Tax=Oscillatoria sp. FACHB-1407 TaxID=2692847 RepID=UPI0016829061|nr:hypothetical protein [Oscillatoria sp. FACHB-1407]MBD2463956.1 hypothetical protein [Oscillatoria sp. FACHB-1407]
MVTKHKSPDYSQVTGHIPKDLARKFRVYCADQDITISEALEIAVGEFLEARSSSDSSSNSSTDSGTDS